MFEQLTFRFHVAHRNFNSIESNPMSISIFKKLSTPLHWYLDIEITQLQVLGIFADEISSRCNGIAH